MSFWSWLGVLLDEFPHKRLPNRDILILGSSEGPVDTRLNSPEVHGS